MLNIFIELIIIFAIYSFIGWFFEVIVDTLQTKKYINAGFLNGPFCPIYGFGVLMILYVLAPFKASLPLFFISSVILTSVFEFIVGYVLEKAFNQKWWDYSQYKFNIKGYIWLVASIGWGILCMVLVYILQPGLDKAINYIPELIKTLFAFIFVGYVVIDLIVTLIALLKVKRKLILLAGIGDKIKDASDTLGQAIHEGTLNMMEKTEDYSKDINNLKIKYENILNKKIFGYKRITKAFPKLNVVDLLDKQRNKKKK